MARQKGILRLTGAIDGVGFYERGGNYYARKSNPISGKRIKSDPAFARTRENMSEFASTAKLSKLLRDTIRPLMVSVKDNTASYRLQQTMHIVKNLDLTSARGQRSVTGGISTAEGKLTVKGFSFNEHAIVKRILYKQPFTDTATGTITIEHLTAAEDITFPQAATHVSLRGGWARVDFATGEAELALTNTENLSRNAPPTDIILTPAEIPTVAGTDFFVLLVSFYQEVNGEQYMLKNGAYNALGIVEVV
jgi:hypothetical protein